MSDMQTAYRRGNYFAEGDYIQTDVGTGVMRNRAGTRMLGLTDDFLRGLIGALDTECGPAAPVVLKSCGRHWGKQYAIRFAKEMEEFYGEPLSKFPLPMFQTMLTESFGHHGWGRLTLDLSGYEQGVFVVTVREAIGASVVKAASQPVEHLLAGVLAGMFAQITGQDLDCLQTECSACGASESRFVLALASRLKSVAGWPEQGKSHDQIIAHLATVRA